MKPLLLLSYLAIFCICGCSKSEKQASSAVPEQVTEKNAVQPATPNPMKAPAPDEGTEKSIKGDPAPTDKDKSSVIADGLGATADDSLKDAFRNAVRQVVGAVVDAETLVKNDQIISDKVLTYSDGLVKSYDEISKTHDKGLFRIKIKATVERRNVIAKLKAANVVVKDIDGKGIFAEVITDLEADKNARNLLERALEGIPVNLLEGEATGKPEILERNAETVKFSVRIRFKVNAKQYDAFHPRLRNALKVIAKSQGTFDLRANPDNFAGNHSPLPEGSRYVADSCAALIGNVLEADNLRGFKGKKGQIVIAVCVASRQGVDTQWEYFVIDDSFKSALISCCYLPSVKVSFLADNGDTIATEIRSGKVTPERFFMSGQAYPYKNKGPFHFITPVCAAPEIRWVNSGDILLSGAERNPGAGSKPKPSSMELDKRAVEWNARRGSLFFISPLFLEFTSRRSVFYSPTLEMRFVSTLSFETVRAVSKIKCEITK